MKLLIGLCVANLLMFSAIFQTSKTSEESPVHHRVRRLALGANSKVSFDVELKIPIPSLGGINVSIELLFPLTITMLNETVLFNPITLPGAVVVLPESQPLPVNYPSYMPNNYGYDSYYGSPGGSPYYHHHAMKRSLGAASAQHRYDLFNSIAETLERLTHFINLF